MAIDQNLKGQLLEDLLENTKHQAPVWSTDGKVYSCHAIRYLEECQVAICAVKKTGYTTPASANVHCPDRRVSSTQGTLTMIAPHLCNGDPTIAL